jgi:hypothetical protein
MAYPTPRTDSALHAVKVDARPNNYGVTHLSISNIPDSVYWTDAVVVRKYTGYPTSPDDGDTIYSTTNQNLIYSVTATTTSSAIDNVTITSGGSFIPGADFDYITYTNRNASGGAGSKATFDVVRSGQDSGGNGSVISVTVNCGGYGYAAGNTLTILKELIGYDATTAPNVTDLVVTVGTVSSANTGSVTAASLVNGTSSINATNIATVTTTRNEAAVGFGALYNRNPGATTLLGGKGYVTGDRVSVPASSLGGTVDTTQPDSVYGITARTHLYDIVGSTTATTVNPATTSADSTTLSVAHTKVYYSVFVKHIGSQNIPYWKKVGSSSSLIVKNTGVLNLMISHVPEFYSLNSVNPDGSNDLVDFLSVFAFQLEKYKAGGSAVFNAANIKETDDTLLYMMLKEFGVNPKDAFDVSQARVLLQNIVRIYQENGSTNGLNSLIEAYTGYNVNTIYGVNAFHDYDTASFEEGLGLWNPTAYVGSNTLNISSVGPLEGASFSVWSDAIDITSPGATIYNALTDNAYGFWRIYGTVIGTLEQGAMLKVVSGTPQLSSGSLITAVGPNTSGTLSSNTVAISRGATTNVDVTSAITAVKASTNLVTGMAKLTTSTTAAGTAAIAVHPKKVVTTSTAASGTTTITISGYLNGANPPAINDYVILGTIGNVVTNPIPYGTYVTAYTNGGAAYGTVTLSSPLASSLASGSVLYFSSYAADRTSAYASYQAVTPGVPYAFSFYAGSTTGATLTQTTTGSIVFYDDAGNTVTTSTSTSSTAVLSANNTWVRGSYQAVAPLNAQYASPTLSITNVASTSAAYLDALQFENGIPIDSLVVVASTTAKITTPIPHNIVSPANIMVTGLGAAFNTTNASVTVVDTKTLSYAITSTATNTTVSQVSGYVSAVTPYQDAKLVKYNIIPSRINYITNPSGELSTKFGSSGMVLGNITSATSVLVGTGLKTFATTTTSTLAVGERLVMAATGGSVQGHITSISAGTSFTMLVDKTTGSGTLSPWTAYTDPGTKFWKTSVISPPNPDASITQATSAALTSAGLSPLSGNTALQITIKNTTTNTATISANAGMVITATTAPYVANQSTPITLYAGKDYILSFYAAAASGYTGSTSSILTSVTYGSGTTSTGIAYATGTTMTTAALPLTAGAWTRYKMTFTVPPSTLVTDTATINFIFYETDRAQALFVDDVLLEDGSVLGTYFDGSFDGYNYGSTLGSESINSMWENNGIDHSTRSHYYKNKVTSLGSLKSIITDGVYYA